MPFCCSQDNFIRRLQQPAILQRFMHNAHPAEYKVQYVRLREIQADLYILYPTRYTFKHPLHPDEQLNIAIPYIYIYIYIYIHKVHTTIFMRVLNFSTRKNWAWTESYLLTSFQIKKDSWTRIVLFVKVKIEVPIESEVAKSTYSNNEMQIKIQQPVLLPYLSLWAPAAVALQRQRNRPELNGYHLTALAIHSWCKC